MEKFVLRRSSCPAGWLRPPESNWTRSSSPTPPPRTTIVIIALPPPATHPPDLCLWTRHALAATSQHRRCQCNSIAKQIIVSSCNPPLQGHLQFAYLSSLRKFSRKTKNNQSSACVQFVSLVYDYCAPLACPPGGGSSCPRCGCLS